MRSFTLLVASSVVLACGARTSLRDDRSGPGGGGGGATASATSSCSRWRLTPTGEIVVLASNIQLPRGLSVGEHGVVFTDPYDWNAEAGTVRVVGIGGGPSTLLAESLPYPQFPFQRDGHVYWVETSDEMSTNHGGIVRIAIADRGIRRCSRSSSSTRSGRRPTASAGS